MIKKLFCDKPFREISIEQKHIKVCCYMPGGAIPKLHPQQVWNHQITKSIRKSILNGTFSYCQKCPLYQTDVQNEQLPHYQPTMETGPTHIALSNDPTCNLSCPSCRENPVQLPPGGEYNYYSILGEQLQHIGQFKDSLKSIEITTMGDPFGSRSYRTLLRILRPRDLPNLKIRLHTNGLLIKDAWPQMRILHNKHAITILMQSIDAATKEIYETNRRGAKWEKLLESLAFIKQIREDGHKFPWYITLVAQSNNWREIPQFVELGKEYDADFINITWLINWRFTRDEYLKRAVHMPGHPDYPDLLKMLEQFQPAPKTTERKYKDAYTLPGGGPIIEMRPIHTAQALAHYRVEELL